MLENEYTPLSLSLNAVVDSFPFSSVVIVAFSVEATEIAFNV